MSSPITRHPSGRGTRFQLGQHMWWSRDPDARSRAYHKHGRRTLLTRAWHGYINVKAIDRITRAPLALGYFPADRNESTVYPEVYQAVVATTGRAPQAVVGDRGYDVTAVYEHNTARGVASVFPLKTLAAKTKNNPICDPERGLRCKKCGGETVHAGFQHNTPYGPRLWYRCQGKGCGRFSVLTKAAPRFLLPMWRTDATFRHLLDTHFELEQVHKDLRVRYGVGPDNAANRPHRVGIAYHRLRAAAALVLEWLRLFAKNRWLDGQDDQPPASPRPLRVGSVHRSGRTAAIPGRSGAPPPLPQAA